MSEAAISEPKASEANEELLNHMHLILKDGRQGVQSLWYKFTWTYWIIVALSICMFLVGIVLISVPLWTIYRGGNSINLESLGIAGFGLLDLVTLYFFRPVSRLQRLMGDMGQITVAFSSYQTQVALFLLETDRANRSTMGKAAQNISKAACNSVQLIQHYFEPDERNEEAESVIVARATQSIQEAPQKIREIVTEQILTQVPGNTNGAAQ